MVDIRKYAQKLKLKGYEEMWGWDGVGGIHGFYFPDVT
jgi:hypothetical protein